MHYEWKMGNGEASRCGVGGRGERAKKSAAHRDGSGFRSGGEGVVGIGAPSLCCEVRGLVEHFLHYRAVSKATEHPGMMLGEA